MKQQVWKKGVGATLAMVVALSAAGCGKDAKEAVPSSAPNQGRELGKPVELTMHMHYGDRYIYDNNFPVFKEAAKRTNVTLKGTASQTATNSKEMFNLMMVSGDIPDIVHYNVKGDFNKYGSEGAFAPLNELIDKHAPNIKAFLEQRPDVKKFATAPDGKMYFLSFVPDGLVAKGWFIRQDWLKALNMQQPKTVDELYQVLKAFKEKDPNKNGKADEIPYFNRVNKGGAQDLLMFWNSYRGIYADQGKVKYGPYEANYETAVANIAKWYKEGLIDPEIFTRGAKAREVLLGDNVGGVSHDWFSSTAGYNDTLKDKVPGILFAPMAPPASSDGVVREETKRATVSESGWAISTSNKHQVETIQYFDFWFTPEGRRLMNFGIEGVHYNLIDGKPKFKDSLLTGSKPVLEALQAEGAQMEVGFHQDFAYEEQWTNKTALAGVKEYNEKKYPIEQFPVLTFTDGEKKKLDSIMKSIQTFTDEKFQKWVLGTEPVAGNFEKFRQQLKAMGLDEVISIQQAAYDRYMK